MTRRLAALAPAFALLALGVAPRAITYAQAPAPLTGGFTGHVTDQSTSRALAGVVVTLTGNNVTRRVVAGADGAFTFEGLGPGSYNIRADRPGYLTALAGQRSPTGAGQVLAIAPGQHASVDLPMWKSGSISGVVTGTGATATPVVGAEIHALMKTVVAGSWQWTEGGITTSDDRGRYRLSNLLPGDYIVVARPLQNPETSVLMAMLSDNATSAADVMATMASTMHEVPDLDARVPASSVTVASTSAAAAAQPRKPLVVSIDPGTARANVDLHVPQVRGVRVSGRIGGAPIPTGGLIVELLSTLPDASGRAAGTQEIEAATSAAGSDGGFEFTNVPAGEYTLAVTWMPPIPIPPPPPPTSGRGPQPPPPALSFSSEPAEWTRAPLTVGAKDMTGVALALRSGAVVSGQVTIDRASTAPPPKLSTVTLRLDPVLAPFVAVPTVVAPRILVDDAGRITSASIPPGRYWLRANAPRGFTVASAMSQGADQLDQPIEIGATGVNIDLALTERPLGVVAGNVSVPALGTNDVVTVILFPAQATDRRDTTAQSRRIRLVRAQPTGAFSIGALPPGDYLVTAIAGDPAAGWQSADGLTALARTASPAAVSLGETTRVTLEVRR